MRTLIFGQANEHLFNTAKRQLVEAEKYLNKGDYDRAFYLFRRSVENSCGRLKTIFGQSAGKVQNNGIFTPEQLRIVGSQSDSLTELLHAIDRDDEKLDILYDFLVDSERQSNGHQAFLYRQMVLNFVAGIDNRPVSVAGVTDSERLERALDLKFALAAYLETFISYQQWCLNFAAQNVVLPETKGWGVDGVRFYKKVWVGASM